MNAYIAAEKRLAELLGYKDLKFHDIVDKWVAQTPSGDSAKQDSVPVPMWARNNDDAVALMLEHTKGYQEREIDGKVCIVVTPKAADIDPSIAYLKDHLYNKAVVLHFAIVSSAIAQAEAAQQLSKAAAPASLAADARKLLPETFLTTLDVLHASFEKYEDGLATHPWTVISSAVEQMLGAYRGTPAFTGDYKPNPNSEATVDILVDEINDLARAWSAYKSPTGAQTGNFAKARDAIVDTLNAFTDFRSAEPTRGTTTPVPARSVKLEV